VSASGEAVFQCCLTLDERQCPQIFSIQEQQIERDEDALTTAEKQL